MAPFKWFMKNLIHPVQDKLIKSAARYILKYGGFSTANSITTNERFSNKKNVKDKSSIFLDQSSTNSMSNNDNKINDSRLLNKNRRNSKNNGLAFIREARLKNVEEEKAQNLRKQFMKRKQSETQKRRVQQNATFSINNKDIYNSRKEQNQHLSSPLSSSSPASKSANFKRCYYVPVINPLPDLKDKQLTVLDKHLYGIGDLDFLKQDAANGHVKLPQSVIDTADIRDLEMYKMNDLLNSFLHDSDQYLEDQQHSSSSKELFIEEVDEENNQIEKAENGIERSLDK